MGTLIWANGAEDINIEYGDNDFIVYGESGPYLDFNSIDNPEYISGNTFSPETPNDTDFVDDWLIPDVVNDWIYTYLRLEDQMDEVLADPGDSIQFNAKIYLEDFVGTVDSDTIIEVGFKYKLQPDSTNWTTCYATNHETDSLYDWWVHVGDYGGVVEYIWWAEDAHGRYLTSPSGADTSAPDEGNTNFTSFEMVQDTIYVDTVTIWAPAILTHDLLVRHRGVLHIKPWPGANDHTITFEDGIELRLYDACGPYGEVYIEGTESMPITIDAVDDTSRWDQIYVYRGMLDAEYTIFRNSVCALNSPYAATVPIIRLDHCTFEGSDGWLLLDGTYNVPGYPEYGSYLNNCVFTDLGTTTGFGSVAIIDGDVEITDCMFYENMGDGIFLWNAGDTEIENCNFTLNSWAGMSSGGTVSSVSDFL